ncbi:CinA family protein [Leifsonia flava]|uniref:Nicotinamide-nucleotide amidohydrolase family protein n=1 Tax=Orlajensenia leifsoniae TaxID=2561933 RepID=A0A4Y9R3B0_9MICO|nr:nicotinamide-nucleotide amidohydrolase family protein [Leifsonia flava]TFV98757.1 nicotinamide-nucleotide amidohydrolase family protein [Leifsonia flava]
MPEPSVRDATADLVAELTRRGLTIAVAESLTGGLLAAELMRIPGASVVVTGGVVAYNTAIKRSVLGVDAALLDEFGAVHPRVAEQMAAGVRSVLAVDGRDADVGIGTTGAAGPDPQDGQPVGTVFIGISIGERMQVLELALDGGRAAIRAAVVTAAIAATLDLLLDTAE